MIIDNFGTIKPNPWRFYRPRIIAPIMDEVADFSSWRPGPLLAVDAEPPTMGTLEGLALDKAQAAFMRAVLQTRVQHDKMRRAGSLGEWHAAAAVEGSGT